MPLPIIRTLHTWLRPSIDAIFARNIPFSYRWRMLLYLQPVILLTYSIVTLPWLFRHRPWTVEYLPIGHGRTLRALIFKSKAKPTCISSQPPLRPLHLDIHGGAFFGGISESDARF